QFQQRKRVSRASSDVICLPTRIFDCAHCGIVSRDQVLDEQYVPDLFAVPENANWLPLLGTDGKPRQPTLVFHAKLPRTVNAGLPENDSLHAVDARIIQHVLIAG